MNASTPEQREAAAREAYPYEHVGYSQPVPDGCSCDECYRTDVRREAYAAGMLAALGITVSDEPEAPGDVIERVARVLTEALFERSPYLNSDQNDAARSDLFVHLRDIAVPALAALGITVSDEPEAPDDVIERARATVERSMGRAWTDEGEYANLPQQAAHDLATAGLLRIEPDERAATVERVRALHSRDPAFPTRAICAHCYRLLPCPTVRALDGEAER